MYQKPEQDTFGNDATDYNVLFAYRVDRNVQILNHCLDDIEHFASRIQKAHEAAKEVNLRQSTNGSVRSTGESIYSLRSKPPSKNEYLTVFAQMKALVTNFYREKNYMGTLKKPRKENVSELRSVLFTR